MALFTGDGWLFLLRWFHFLAGITWIGLLYYFNFVQTPFFASATQVSKGGQAIPDAAARGQRSGFASRTNTLLSIPMLFFMGAASHLAMADPTGPGAKVGALILLAIVLAAAEVNALVGTTGPGKKMLSTLNGTFWGGVILTAILYFLF